MNLPLWYKSISVIFILLLILSLYFIILTLYESPAGDSAILVYSLLPSFIGIMYQIMIVFTSLLKRSWGFFIKAEVIFLIAWLVVWLIMDGGDKYLGLGLIVLLSLPPIAFYRNIIA